jgi:uroporphyrinogen decarboxylase
MNSKERVLKAFRKMEGNPDRVPLQFDLCRQLTEAFGEKLRIVPDYSLSYYEDLTYRISANAIRTVMGSDVIVVGGSAFGYVPETVAAMLQNGLACMETRTTLCGSGKMPAG